MTSCCKKSFVPCSTACLPARPDKCGKGLPHPPGRVSTCQGWSAGAALKRLFCRCCYDASVVLLILGGLAKPQHALWGATATCVLNPLLVEVTPLDIEEVMSQGPRHRLLSGQVPPATHRLSMDVPTNLIDEAPPDNLGGQEEKPSLPGGS